MRALSRITVALAIACGLAAATVTPAALAAFPGANGRIAYFGYSPSSFDADVFTINPDGTGRMNPGASDRWQTEPAWSPDGSQIAFSRYEGGARFGVHVMNADGSGIRRLAGFQNTGSEPGWSPDGRKIVFSLNATGEWPQDKPGEDLYVVDVSTSEIVQLTSGPELDQAPSWSPDGDKIAFARGTEGPCSPTQPNILCHRFDVYTVNPDGSGLTNVTLDPSIEGSNPDWSPDGSKIAFDRRRFGVFIMNPDGSGLTRLNAVGEHPAWSPDGRQIAYSAFVFSGPGGSSNEDIFVSDLAGGSELNVTNTLVDVEEEPSWQPLNRPPDCEDVIATPNSLRAHNGRFTRISLSGATDADGDPVAVAINGVTQDEPVRRRPDARSVSRPFEVDLRADRAPRGDGRVYRIVFGASDHRGGECDGVATVEVRRKKNQPAVDSAPPSFDSFAAGPRR